jgi:hypothetical protein
MRYILIILFFISVGTKAQMVIKAYQNYVPLGGGNLLLDEYPGAAAAYSLRKLDKDYTGSAIRVRKDTTGQPEQDIGFTAAGNLDTAALKNFVLNNSAFVTTWYSQGDSASVNFTQSTQANQPRIALNGVIDRLAGDPSVRFDGSNDFMTVASSTGKFEFLHRSGLSSVFIVSQIRAGNADYVFYSNNSTAFSQTGTSLFAGATNRVTSQVSTGNTSVRVSSNATSNNFTVTNNLFLISLELDNANSTAANRNKLYYNNGAAVTNNINTGTASTSSTSSTNMILGRQSPGDAQFHLNGSITELIFYKGNKTSDRSAIQTNINNYYGIY